MTDPKPITHGWDQTAMPHTIPAETMKRWTDGAERIVQENATLRAQLAAALAAKEEAEGLADEWHEKFQDEMQRNATQALRISALEEGLKVAADELDDAAEWIDDHGTSWAFTASAEKRAAIAKIRMLLEDTNHAR